MGSRGLSSDSELAAAVESSDDLEPTELPGAASATVLIDAGHEFERLARLGDARNAYEVALRSLEPGEGARRAPSILRWIARTFQRSAAYEEALDCVEASLASAEAFGDLQSQGHGINLLAIIRWQQGDLDEAKRLYLHARETAHRAGETKLAAMTAQNLGVIASVRGESEQALRYFSSSLAEYRALGLDQDVCVALNNLGLLHSRSGAWDESEQAFREALAIANTRADLEVATQLEVNLVGILVARERWDEARRTCERAMLLAKTRGVDAAMAEAHKFAGIISRERQEMEAAEREFEAGFAIAVARQNLLLQAEIERERALMYRVSGRNRETLQSLNRSQRLFSQLQARSDIADVNRQSRALEGDFVEVARRWGETTESKDRYTQGHCERVADVACRLAVALDFDQSQMFWFRIGSLLHDVGKLIIPSEVLNKPGRLTKEEWDLMKRHPQAGVELLSEIEFPWDVLPIVRSHHECWDGSGYPDALAGNDIPLPARIVCFADVYDALTTERSYKRALSHEEAVEVMRRDVGRQFDPSLFPVFEQVVNKWWRTVGKRSNTADATREAGDPGSAVVAPDDLTGLLTRRPFTDRATAVLSTLVAGEDEATILVIDVDHFKQVNDTFGHLQGDAVLREVARALKEASRNEDVVARYAGDEFVILLPATSLDTALQIGERLRAHVEQLRVPLVQSEEGSVAVSLSIGVASAPRHGSNFESVFGAADRALYEAKRRGRNAVAPAGDESSSGKPRLDMDRFIGREQELKRLVGHFERCVRGDLQIVAVTGEAGIGKTTLLRKLEPEVRLRTGAVVFGRSHEPDVRPPYGPWVEAISALHRMGIVPARDWRELPRIVPALRRDGYELDARPSGDKYELLDEIVEYLRAACASRTLVVVLDDMQWGDRASWDALEHLMVQLEDARLMLCLTIRTEDSEHIAVSRRRLSRSERFHEMQLLRLRQSDVSDWVARVMHQAEMSQELPALLYQYSEGNPLFVVQILRELVEEGAIWYGGKRWEWNRVEEFKLPTAVDDLLARRLSRLSPGASQILTIASVAGRSFDLETIERAADVTEDALLDAIDEGVKSGVIAAVQGTDGEHYVFAHGLLAEALRRGANPRRLQRVRRRVAEVVESLRPHSLTEIAVLYDQGGDAERAHEYALRAGARAANVYALDDAISAYRIAARRATGAGERLDARLALIEVMRLAGQYSEGERICAEILLEEHDATAPSQRIMIERIELQLRMLQGETPRAVIQKGRDLLARADGARVPQERIELLTLLSEAHARLNELYEAGQLAREALEHAIQIGSGPHIADTRIRLGITLFDSSPAQALEHFEQAANQFKANGDRYGTVRCHVNAGIVHARLGQATEAAGFYEEAIRIAEESHITDLGALASLNLGVLVMRRGDHGEAGDHFGRAAVGFRRVHNEPRRHAALYNQANLARDCGDTGEALGLYAAAARLAEELGLQDVLAGAVAGGGLSAISLGMSDVAERAHDRLIALSANSGEGFFQGSEIVEAFLLRHAFEGSGNLAAAVQRAERAIEAFGAQDHYAKLWLISECAQLMLDAGWTNGREIVATACGQARELGAAALEARLRAVIA